MTYHETRFYFSFTFTIMRKKNGWAQRKNTTCDSTIASFKFGLLNISLCTRTHTHTHIAICRRSTVSESCQEQSFYRSKNFHKLTTPGNPVIFKVGSFFSLFSMSSVRIHPQSPFIHLPWRISCVCACVRVCINVHVFRIFFIHSFFHCFGV